jgi:hypothetical protein
LNTEPFAIHEFDVAFRLYWPRDENGIRVNDIINDVKACLLTEHEMDRLVEYFDFLEENKHLCHWILKEEKLQVLKQTVSKRNRYISLNELFHGSWVWTKR